MPLVGELRQLVDRSTGELRLYVFLENAHGRELWEDVGTGRQLWIGADERLLLEYAG